MKNTLNWIGTFLLVVLVSPSCTPDKKICDVKNTILYDAKLKVFSTLEDAKSCVSDKHKPILLVFEIINGSTRKSISLLSKYIERENLDEEYRIVFLYVDDQTLLKNEYDAQMPNGENKTIKTVGEKNMLTQIEMFNLLATPYHVIIDQKLNNLKEPHGFFSNDKMIDGFFKL